MAVSITRSPKLLITRSLSRVRVRSLSMRSKQKSNSVVGEQSIEFLRNEGGGLEENAGWNKVMVVVDSSIEAKGALEWALSHTVQSQDIIVLLYVKKGPESGYKLGMRTQQILHSMKVMCQRRKPGVQVEVAIREGKEKGQTIVEEAKQQRATLLVLGHRKWPIMWRLIRRLAGKQNSRGGVVQYCIQNASCMTIAVRRNKKLGGYLITTKRHKKFWLLA